MSSLEVESVKSLPEEGLNKPIEIEEEDLEDGEIDDDEDDDDVVITKVETKSTSNSSSFLKKDQQKDHIQKDAKDKSNQIEIIDLIKDSSPTTSPTHHTQTTHSKKPQPVEDDHAISIEKALANVLKKKGLQPIFPKLESRHMDEVIKDLDLPPNLSLSRSSRRRKRRKEQKEKDRDRKDKKKQRYDSELEESQNPGGAPPLDDENDMDDYEMLNVRGGSPPPVTVQPASAHFPMHPTYNEAHYGSGDDSAMSSYDSYDSEEERSNDEDRRREKKNEKKPKRKRDRKEKKRQESDDEKRSVPTIWELCKFYLLERCAKRNHCSYMHAEFPCKYYYLGMDCESGDDCKFLHGEPLNGQLRNILLKHLETAPKEILGNFKRLTRENALQLMSKRHEKLCRQYNVQNTWPTLQQLLQSYGRRGPGNGSLPEETEVANQSPSQTNQKTGSGLAGQNLLTNKPAGAKSEIPSLLDMVIAPPDDDDDETLNDPPISSKPEPPVKHRKSRWADNNQQQSQHHNKHKGKDREKDKDKDKEKDKEKSKAKAKEKDSLPSNMDLKNLKGLINQKYYDKLTELGIKNLQEVKEFRVGELDEMGLTMDEVKDIYTIIEKLKKSEDLSAERLVKPDNLSETAPSRDVDMRFIPRNTSTASVTTATSSLTTPLTSTTTGSAASSVIPSAFGSEDIFPTTSSNSNSSSIMAALDISQYLKEANLSLDRVDMDDEMDDEQLIIDDGNQEKDDLAMSRKDSQEKKLTKMEEDLLSTKMQVPDLAATLSNPFKSLYGSFGTNKDEINSHFSFGEKKSSMSSSSTSTTSRNPFAAYSEEKIDNDDKDKKPRPYLFQDDFIKKYSRPMSRSRSRSRSGSRSRTPSRSRSVTPEASQSSNDANDMDRFSSKYPLYKRKTIYDYCPENEDEEKKNPSVGKDRDMRFLQGRGFGDSKNDSGDIDFRLPFEPIKNYVPATEIDGSISSHKPIEYQVYDIHVPTPNYTHLRNNFKTSTDTMDPRLRRILGLPELSASSKPSSALARNSRKTSLTIASPESEDNQKYYTPPSKTTSSGISSSFNEDNKNKVSSSTTSSSSSGGNNSTGPSTAIGDPRRKDPRRAASSVPPLTTSSNQVKPPMGSPSQSSSSLASSSSSTSFAGTEIRSLLNKSEWYKNLNSKFKILVNQQLALVSTELKKFHQDPSPNKIFDISFIVNNNTLQQILTNLGIYIDDNGDVVNVEPESDESPKDGNLNSGGNSGGNAGNNLGNNIQLPNLSQPPPNAQNRQMDFLRAPPPNMQIPLIGGNQNNSVGQGPIPSGNPNGSMPPQMMQGMGGMQSGPGPNGPRNPMNPFASNIQNARPSLLGLPPGVVNPFMSLNPNLLGGAGVPPAAAAAAAAANMIAAAAFNNFGPGALNLNQRNFNHNQQRSRRSKKI